jgi:hypothetical protein
MPTATSEVERIVRKVLKEEQDETISAIQELSSLLTEQVIPKLANRGNGASEWEPPDGDDENTEDQDDAVALSGFDEGETTSRRRGTSTNGRDEGESTDLPEQEVPRAAIEAFTTLYHTLSPEQTSALAELFTIVDSELDGQGEAADEQSEEEEARVHA